MIEEVTLTQVRCDNCKEYLENEMGGPAVFADETEAKSAFGIYEWTEFKGKHYCTDCILVILELTKTDFQLTKTDFKKNNMLTSEKEISDLLVKAHSRFSKLTQTHPNDLPDWVDGIHNLQRILATRIARRDYPEEFKTIK